MKKRKWILIVSMMIICCTGCGKNYSDEELTTEDSRNKFPEFSFDSTQKPYYQKDNHAVAIAENGYYFVRNISFGSFDNFGDMDYLFLHSQHDIKKLENKAYGKMIYYYDIDSGTATPLCSKVDCKHNDENCEAYFDTIEGTQNGASFMTNGGFQYYNHRLYMISYDSKNGTKLVSYDNQGKNQKDECVIASDPEFYPYFGGTKD
ncbi:MAG: hypothetical protein Q4F11_07475, partial [Eubacteriales bacterium]|nr:hypothetical protein [Eubacteriales bacterium]